MVSPNTMATEDQELARRHLRMVLVAAAAGATSALAATLAVDPLAAVRGALLAAGLSLGIVAVNRANRRALDEGDPDSPWKVVLPALLTGAGAGALMALVNLPADRIHQPEFQVSSDPFATFVLGICYAVALHFAYASRWSFKSLPGLKTGLTIAIAGFACGVLKGAEVTDFEDPGVWPLIALFTGVPFALLWFAAIAALDPAWTLERWRARPASRHSNSKATSSSR